MTTVENVPVIQLPVRVRDYPHWRVTYRPSTYDAQRIASVAECLRTVTKYSVRLRGWDFPHVPGAASEIEEGEHWVGGWADFDGHIEYWRFYQSTQFLHLGSVREFTEEGWAEELRRESAAPDAPGFLAVRNLVYTVTEMFEFAARLAQGGIYSEPVEIAIQLKNVAGFDLVFEDRRAGNWPRAHIARAAELTCERTIAPVELVASSAEIAASCASSLLDDFGWPNVGLSMIRGLQQDLLSRRT